MNMKLIMRMLTITAARASIMITHIVIGTKLAAILMTTTKRNSNNNTYNIFSTKNNINHTTEGNAKHSLNHSKIE